MSEKRLKIYFTSDVHGYFYPTSYGDRQTKQMGLFQCASQYEKDEETLVIDGGDILQGAAFAYYCSQKLHTPRAIAERMNACDYDYYTIGNHDFNYGREYQKEYISRAKAHCICQNIEDADGHVLYPYVIRTMPNGLRIGLVGIVTDYINVWEKKENLGDVRVKNPFEAARQALAELKPQVDLTICVYHGGFECDLETGKRLSDTTENVGYRICQELDFDILLTGHQHMSIDGRDLNGTYVVQPVEYAKEYHRLSVTVDGAHKHITSEKMAADTGVGEALRTRFQPLEEDVQNWLDEPMGHLSRALLPQDKLTMALNGSPIADFLNRVQLYFSQAQVSVVGLANEVAGFRKDVSMRDIIATYPYPNTLIVCRIAGAGLKLAMERSAEYFAVNEQGEVQIAQSFIYPKQEHYNYDYYAGVDYRIDPRAELGSRIVSLSFQGRPVAPQDEFTLVLNNYRFSGTGGYPMYPRCEVLREINIEMVELIMEYFMRNSYVEI